MRAIKTKQIHVVDNYRSYFYKLLGRIQYSPKNTAPIGEMSGCDGPRFGKNQGGKIQDNCTLND
jgi:hypothetical protein